MDRPTSPRLSVVVATYNRQQSLERLLGQLAEQTLAPDAFEVVVVDDGSRQPVRAALASLALSFPLHLEEQANAGAAAARQRGAGSARAEILVFLDDDMQVGPGFLDAHLAAHPPGSRSAVLGVLRAPTGAWQAPLFHRWHQTRLEEFYAAIRAGRLVPRGWHLYTGNLSLRRDDFLAVGGFDVGLGRSEDAELGMRLESAGVKFELSEEAWAINAGDHTDAALWRAGAVLYGATDVHIARKHPDRRDASVWRYLGKVNPLVPPVIVGAAMVPAFSRALASAIYAVATALDGAGLRRAAFVGTTLTYGLDYLRGYRGELGSAAALLGDLARYLAAGEHPTAAVRTADAVRRFADAVKADHRQLDQYGEKYGHHTTVGSLAPDLVRKIGLQMLVGVRLMYLFRDLGMPLATQITSRVIRHLYTADIHWDTDLAPGIVIAHGYGLGIGHGTRMGPGCIVLHNCSFGRGKDQTGREGAPTLEANVHVGPHSILLGPITVGAGSKIAAGSLLLHSVPPRSLVTPTEAHVGARGSAAAPSAAIGAVR